VLLFDDAETRNGDGVDESEAEVLHEEASDREHIRIPAG
jgi:hypothetical protein